MENERILPCDSYCEHGGICVLDRGHDGQHDSNYCQWTDDTALPKDEADALFFSKADAIGQGEFARASTMIADTLTEILEEANGEAAA